MALKLHQMTGEPVANCSYLLGQTNGDYEMALKILERILQQRQAGKTGSNPAEDECRFESENGEPGTQTMPDALEHRVYRLETRLAQLADTLDTVNEKLTLLLDKISDPDAP
ncbi:MAG: hypothetical protein JWQ21_37 [Herminiimonas sp.]|nr:hypothetical protein [Herminiimonas sp.]